MRLARAYVQIAAAVLMTFGFMAPYGVTEASNHKPESLVPIRGGLNPEHPKKARLVFTVSPSRCVRSCFVVLKAELEAPAELCIARARFITEREGCRTATNRDGCDQDMETECSERRWSKTVFYSLGKHKVGFELTSEDGTKAAANDREFYVGVPEEESR